MDLWSILVLFCVIQSGCAAIYKLDEDEYARMPPLVSVDEYHRCLRRPGGRYCSAYAGFVEGDPQLLTIMQKYSEHSSLRFNHTRAFFGRCISHFNKNKIDTTSDPSRVLEGYINRSVWDQYRLKVKIEGEVYCHEHGEKKPDVGIADIIVAAMLLGFVICNLVGSLFDVFSPKTWKKGYYVGQFLLFFSVPRNWKILTAAPDTKMDSLKGIYGIRAISTILVIVAHSLLPAMVAPENPKFIEDLYELPLFHLLLNGTVIMQTFLFISAFLLVYCCLQQGAGISWQSLPMGLLKRWMRLTPPYVVMLAVTATWLPYVGSGPLWDVIVTREGESCRRLWWQNLLYINNYFDDTECMRQTWYLATDMQLYCVGLCVMAWSRSRRRQLVLAALFLLGVLAPALHTYLQDLDGVLLASPSAGSVLFMGDRTFDIIYKRGHTNVSSYVLGLAAGYLVHHMQRNNFNAHKYKAWRPLYWLLLPIGIALPISCQAFYTSPRVDVVYRAVAAALARPVFGLLVGAIIVGMILHIDTVYRGAVEWRGWVPLSRVSYAAYLVHATYIRLGFGALDHTLWFSIQRGSEIVLLSVVIVYVMAYIFWLTIEAPLSHLVKSCLQRTGGTEKEKQNGVVEHKVKDKK